MIYELFPSVVESFNLIQEEQEFDKVILNTREKLSDVEWIKNCYNHTSKNFNILNNNDFEPYKKVFKNRVNKYLSETLDYDYDEVILLQSWINLTNNGESHHSHDHKNSLVSGVFFLDGDMNSGDLILNKPYLSSFSPNKKNTDESVIRHWDQFYIKPVTGNLWLFPSYLTHLVSPHMSSSVSRVSISFNAIINLFGGPGLTQLKINYLTA